MQYLLLYIHNITYNFKISIISEHHVYTHKKENTIGYGIFKQKLLLELNFEIFSIIPSNFN
jgi:hypothetical protein